jgi:ABC-type glycerol-3-phosphate transport system permease component
MKTKQGKIMGIETYRLARYLTNFFTYFILTAFALIMLFPFAYMTLSAAYAAKRSIDRAGDRL